MVLAAAAASLLMATPAAAAVVTDVNNLIIGIPASGAAAVFRINGDIPPDANPGLHNQAILQTWLSHTTGQLVEIDMFGNVTAGGPNDPGLAVLNIYSGAPGALNFLGAYTQPLNSLSGSSLKTFDLTSLGINVVSNQTYSFSMDITPCLINCSWSTWDRLQGGVNTDLYFGGQMYIAFHDPGETVSTWSPNTGRDANFRVLVDKSTGAVPEPATWAMMILGMFGVGAAMRRRRESPTPA